MSIFLILRLNHFKPIHKTIIPCRLHHALTGYSDIRLEKHRLFFPSVSTPVKSRRHYGADNIHSGRFSDSSRLVAPSQSMFRPMALFDSLSSGIYSSGYCSGFTPDSLSKACANLRIFSLTNQKYRFFLTEHSII